MTSALRTFRASDVPILIGMRTDARIQRQLAARTFSGDTENAVEWIERATSDDRRKFFIIQDPHTGKAIGFLQIFNFKARASCCQIGLALSRSFQGRGLGTQALQEALAHIHAAGIRRVELLVRLDNAKAQKLYLKLGFRPIGVDEIWVMQTTLTKVMLMRLCFDDLPA